MGAKTLRFIYCVELLFLLGAPAARAQMSAANSPTPTFTSSPSAPGYTPIPTRTPFFTPTYSFTPTPTNTVDLFATPTATRTWNPYESLTQVIGSPTGTYTATSSFTFTPTGTLTPSATFTPTWTNTPGISRASLALLPTAFTNAWDRTNGFEWDMGFTYYIGSLVSREYSKPDIDSLEPSRFALLTSDVKYAWLKEDGDVPGIASGALLSFLAQLASGNSGTGSGTQTFSPGSTSPGSSGGVTTGILGAVYGVMSKSVSKDTAVHFGYIYGLQNVGFINMNYSQLLPLLTTKLQMVTDSPSGIFYTGFNTRFWGRNWKFEILKPFPMAQNPVLLNTQVEGLPLAFNLGYERWDQGWALLGYVNFRFTILPQTPLY